MAKYIDADKLVEKLEKSIVWCEENLLPNDFRKGCIAATKDIINTVQMNETSPAADVVEVAHGEWILDRGTHKCSSCGFGMFMYENTYFQDGVCLGSGRKMLPYCPNCGARMDGLDGEKE